MNVREKAFITQGLGVGAAVGLLLLSLTATGCNRGNVQAAPAMPPPLVTVATASAHDVPRYLN